MDPKDGFRDDSHRNGHGTVRVVLEGGPAYVPSEMRLHRGVLIDRKVKVPCRGGYEHFELVDLDRDEPPADEPQAGKPRPDEPRTDDTPVFRWIMRTKVAE